MTGTVGEHRVFAALYDTLFSGIEKKGMRELRANLLRDARGSTLEIGAGTGFNIPHYTDAVTELVLTEPDRFMAARLRKKLDAEPPATDAVKVVEAPAENLPFDTASFDTVVSTLVLCSVDDPLGTATEISRVLKPGGRLLVLEHVRSPDRERLAGWQDRLERPWGWLFGGCHPNRVTEQTLARAGIEFDQLERPLFPKGGGPLVRPMIRGVATRGGVPKKVT